MNPETLPLHLLRPHALWLLCALPLAWAWLRRRRRPDDVWQASIDPHLRPHVLETPSPRVRGAARWPMWLAWGLAVLALSGPAWRRSPQPAPRPRASWRQALPRAASWRGRNRPTPAPSA